jgi:hypothetical protein
MPKKPDDTEETTTEERDEGLTAAEDAFESELEGVISDALNDEVDDDDEDLEDVDDLDDDDDDDDEVDDDDLDDELGEGGQPRDEQGKFTKADEANAGAKPTDDAAVAKPDAAAAAGEEKKPDAAAAETPKWETLSVNVDKQLVAIDEAKISKANGHLFIAIPEKEGNRFLTRLSRGIVGEKLWRDLHNGLRELDARKNAPPAKSENEVEADVVMELLKPSLGKLYVENEKGEMVPFLDDRDMQLLELKIENAKTKTKTEYATAEAARVAKAAEAPWEEQQIHGLAQQVASLIQNFPDLQSLTKEEIEEVYQRELLPVRNALVYRDEKGSYANTQFMYDRLKDRADRKKAAAATSDPSALTQTPQGNSATTAAPEQGKTKTDKAERFNRGVDAAKTRTTSVKANRDDRPRKRNTRDGDERSRRKKARTPREERESAEDEWRRTERAFLNSPDLDFNVSESE